MRFLSIEPLLEDLGEVDLAGIDWVIVGGESGPGARPLEKAWVVSIRDQCRAAGIPFFFKQWGGVRKSKAGRYARRPDLRRAAGTVEPSRRFGRPAKGLDRGAGAGG